MMPFWQPSLDPAKLPKDVPLPPPLGSPRHALDVAYYERNRMVAAFVRLAIARGGSRAWLGIHEQRPGDPDPWPAEWRYVVYLELPTGQVSWHIHELERPMFGFLRLDKYAPVWDGHTTKEKYDRVAAYVARCDEFAPQPRRRSRWWRWLLWED
jgi:hypothetical protein